MGALVNGVFLVALCLSIFLEAIQRFVEPQEVSNPKLILIVGSFGLASNIVGLFLFHDHGHSHGGHSHGGHSHAHSHDELGAAEEGHGHSHDPIADESGNVADVLPQNKIGNWPQSKNVKRNSGEIEDGSSSTSQYRRHSRSRSRVDDFPIHPASFRNEIINAARRDESDSDDAVDENGNPSENSPLLGNKRHSHNGHAHGKSQDSHANHKHAQPKDSGSGGHGHSHEDLNMKGVFLHVMGDALGNVGVIASALIIWLTPFSWRFYSDPAISLIITVIILCSAIPLCRAASRILLQAAPSSINVEDIQDDIVNLPGIISCHHLHVWQLSDTKLVASLHVQVEFDFKGQGSARYMELARAIRKCLHEYGIHSSTIQPEFCLNEEHDHVGREGSGDDSSCDGDHAGRVKGAPITKQASATGSLRGGQGSREDSEACCLLDCGDACGDGKQCCPPKTPPVEGQDSCTTQNGGGHSHSNGHRH